MKTNLVPIALLFFGLLFSEIRCYETLTTPKGETSVVVTHPEAYTAACKEYLPKSTFNIKGLMYNECRFQCVGLHQSGKLVAMGQPQNEKDGRICRSEFPDVPSRCLGGSCVFTDNVWKCRRVLRGVKLVAIYQYSCGITCVGDGLKRIVPTVKNGRSCGQGWKCIDGICKDPSHQQEV